MATYNRASRRPLSVSLNSFQSIPTSAFLDALASREPVPGGGTAAAVTGAHGTALLCMVLNLTVGRRRFQRHEGILKPIQQRLEANRLALLNLADQDAAAYAEVDRCLKLPAPDPSTQAVRRMELDQALHAAATVPLQVADTCRGVLDASWEVANRGNRTVLSDVMVGTHLLLAAVHSSNVNVHVNLRMATPGAEGQTLAADIAACIKDAVGVSNRILDRCTERMDQSR